MQINNLLSIDIETYSGADIKKCGLYKYAEDPDFDILLFSYAVNNGPVSVIDIASGEKIPPEVLQMLIDTDTEKWAFNAAFERVCLSHWLSRNHPDYFALGKQSDLPFLKPEGWKCSMVLSAYNGLPLSLAAVGSVLRLDQQKMEEGKSLIHYFSCPATSRKTKALIRHMPSDDPQKWAQFKLYNIRDVETEMEIRQRLRLYPVPAHVWAEYALDQRINDRGICLDQAMATQAVKIGNDEKERLKEELIRLTGMENPNSSVQLKHWLQSHGVETESVDKDEIEKLLPVVSPDIQKVLKLSLQLSMNSLAKYAAMKECVCPDGRVRGMFQFYGANRSGRWAGRLVQMQNLPKNYLEKLDLARELVKNGDGNGIMTEFGTVSISEILSQLVRTAFIAGPDKKLIVSDYSAIEARVLAYLAGESWKLDVFRQGGDIYCASASAMFHVQVVKHGENGHLRQKGKIAELALGYGGGAHALEKGARDAGIPFSELDSIVMQWREANPNIVSYWRKVGRIVRNCITTGATSYLGPLRFRMENDLLFIDLPSGRSLCYCSPMFMPDDYSPNGIVYFGMNSKNQWNSIRTYGAKIVENIVQAYARDILAYAMGTLRDYNVIAHVHDELIIECDRDESVERICSLMEQVPPWAPGLPLRCEGYETPFYKKD